MGLSEAKPLGTLKHKNLIDILGTSGNERVFIIVMEYLSGGSLSHRLVQPLPLAAALGSAREICEGLSFTHRNRIVHGNLRPSNILFTESGQVKRTDFGLEEHYTSGQGGRNWYNVFGESKSPGADIFAAGAVFYQMLTGSLPKWKGAKMVPSDRFKQLPTGLQEMVMRMLARVPQSRYGSFDEVIQQIDAEMAAHKKRSKRPRVSAVPGRPQRKKSRWPLWILLLLLLVSAITAVVYLNYAGDDFSMVALWQELKAYFESILTAS